MVNDLTVIRSRRGLLVVETVATRVATQCGNIERTHVHIGTECWKMVIGTSNCARDVQPDGATVFI